MSGLIETARTLWRDRQEDCAQYGADISMPTVEVPVDLLVSLFDQLTTARKAVEIGATAEARGAKIDRSIGLSVRPRTWRDLYEQIGATLERASQ